MSGGEAEHSMIPKRRRPRDKYLKAFLLFATTALILLILFKKVGFRPAILEIKHARGDDLICAFLLSIGFILLAGLKWALLIRIAGHEISMLRCQKITLAACTLNALVPSKGGDLVKCLSIRDRVPLATSLGITIFERLVDIGVLCLIALAGSMILDRQRWVLASTVLCLICFVSFMMLRHSHRIDPASRFGEHLNYLGTASRQFLTHPRQAVFVTGISAVIWLGSAYQIHLLYTAVHQSVPFTYVIKVFAIIIMVGLLPVTVAGMGTRDAAFIYFFSMYATDPASISVGIFFSLFRYWLLAILGIPFLGSLRKPASRNGKG